MLQAGEQITLTIDDLAGTAGIGRVSGYAVMVEGALPGEQVSVRIEKAGKRYATAKLLKVLVGSKERTEAPCPHFGVCGGCQLQHLAYPAQLVAKQNQVRDALERIGGLSGVEVLPTLGMQHPWRYRNKAVFPVAAAADGSIRVGLYEQGSHVLVDVEDCLLQHPNAKEIALGLKKAMAETGATAYDERTHKGLVRHLMVRTAFSTGQSLAVIAVNGQGLPNEKRFVEILRKACPCLCGILISPNTRRTQLALGESVRLLWGEPVLKDTLMGRTFDVSPHSFFQVNPDQTEVLYRTAVDYAALTGKEQVLDLYCGIGTITQALAPHAKHVIGVEVVDAAIADARAAAKQNGVENVSFFAGDAARLLPQILKDLHKDGADLDVAVLDPPRKGCEASVLHALANAAPKHIVYVSCNPATLARDAAILQGLGYRAAKAQPVDMFGQTGHVECVVLMSREKT